MDRVPASADAEGRLAKPERRMGLHGHADRRDRDAPEWAGKILVPYCLESKLGGVQRLLQADEALWYHRTFAADAADGLRTLLHFEAVDYACRV